MRLLLTLLLLAGCSQPNPAPNAPTTTKRRIAFVTNNASDFWSIARKGTEKADAELENVDVEFRIPAGIVSRSEPKTPSLDGLPLSSSRQ